MAALDSNITPLSRDDRLINRALAVLKKRMRVPGEQFSMPSSVRDYLLILLSELEREVFACLFLDSQNRLIESEILFYGTLTIASIYPREVVKQALRHNAAAVILAHNHPSGRPEPSKADEELTLVLKNALALVDVRLLDHFVIGDANTYPVSLAERGLV